MALTPEKYQRLKELVSSDGLSAAVREKALAAIQAHEEEFLDKGVGATEARPAEGEVRLIERGGKEPTSEERLVADVKRQLDPSLPVPPQVLALQPSTTHPKGDEAAKDEWVRGDLDNPNGTVVVYEAPAATVRRKIMENPGILPALGFEAPLTPDGLMRIEPGDAVHQAYNDYEFRRVADAAAKAGKTAYRYSKAPWMQGGKNASVLTALSTKLKHSALPALEAASAFIMGEDEIGGFGAATSAREAGLLPGAAPPLAPGEEKDFDYHPTLGKVPKGSTPEAAVEGAKPIGSGKTEVVGGIATADADDDKAESDMLREEHPRLHTAGQVLGAVPGVVGAGAKLAAKGVAKTVGVASKAAGEAVERVAQRGIDAVAHWNPANSLWEWVTEASMATKGPALLKGIGTGAAASATQQAVTEGVRAGANLAGTGETGTTLGGAAARVFDAAGEGAIWASPGTLGQLGSAAHARSVREGPRYDQLPGRLEHLGIAPKFGRGFVAPPAVEEARAAARARDVRPIDIFAERLERPLGAAAKTHVQTTNAAVGDVKREVFRSREGRMLLPVENLASETVKVLRERTAPIGRGAPTAIGTPNAQNPVRGIFNANIGGVSVTPMKGAIALDVKEAEAYLNPVWRRRTLRAMDERKTFSRPGSSLARTESPAPRGGAAAEASDELATAAPPGGLAPEPRGLARVPRYRGARAPELGANDMQRAAPDDAVRGARSAPRGEEPSRVTARNLGPDAGRARWRRRGGSEEKASAARKPVEPGTFGETLRQAGVRKVYVLPRRYNAQQHESALQLLRRSGDKAKDRDVQRIYHAALRDRDARPWQGVPGGWSALQAENERAIGAAKDTRRRVAPPTADGTYRATTRIARQRTGQSKDLTAMEAMANRAQVADDLRSARALDPLEKLATRLTHTRQGELRAPWSPTGLFDRANIHLAYPITRQLEKPNLVGSGQSARLAGIGEGDDEAEKRTRARDQARVKDYRAETKDDRAESGKKKRRRTPPKKRRRREETNP